MEIFKMNMDQTAKQSDLDALTRKLGDYAKSHVVKEMQSDLSQFVSVEKFHILQADMSDLKKDVG